MSRRLSLSETPSTGSDMSAEPPPETRQMIKSRAVARRQISRISRAPCMPFSSGIGCPAWLMRTVRVDTVLPYFTLTTPPVTRSPRISSTAAAMGAAALPAPTT